MINLTWLRDEPKRVIALIKKKEPKFDIERLYELDEKLRAVRFDVESLRQKKNELAQEGKKGVTQNFANNQFLLAKNLRIKNNYLMRFKGNLIFCI